jgi:hypothetical protein
VLVDYCFWKTIVPVVTGNVVCGVRVNAFPETQYEREPTR